MAQDTFSQLKLLARIPFGLANTFRRALSCNELIYPEFVSQTVDVEDISLVQSLLKQPEAWTDEEPISSYESSFAEWNGSLGARSFMGGRVALSALISALQLKPGDEVLIPGYTCVVVANAFSYAGIGVKYYDIELDTYGPDAFSLEQAISLNTRAIVIHHLYGLVARDLERILDIASSRRISVIEDCAHSTGASFAGRKVGNFGDVSFFSSEQSKVLSTFNGGIAVTNDPEILERLDQYQKTRPFPTQEQTKKLLLNFILSYQLHKDAWRWLTSDFLRFKNRKILLQSTTFDELAGVKPKYYGQRMPAPLATVASSQLEKVDVYNHTRRVTAKYWDTLCAEKGFKAPFVLKGSVPVYLRYPVMVSAKYKYDLKWGIKEFGVRQGFWFSGELHPIARQMENCPNARRAVEQCINLPTLGFNP